MIVNKFLLLFSITVLFRHYYCEKVAFRSVKENVGTGGLLSEVNAVNSWNYYPTWENNPAYKRIYWAPEILATPESRNFSIGGTGWYWEPFFNESVGTISVNPGVIWCRYPTRGCLPKISLILKDIPHGVFDLFMYFNRFGFTFLVNGEPITFDPGQSSAEKVDFMFSFYSTGELRLDFDVYEDQAFYVGFFYIRRPHPENTNDFKLSLSADIWWGNSPWTVKLTAKTSKKKIEKYYWSFDDGTGAETTENTITHTYDYIGRPEAVVMAVASDGTKSIATVDLMSLPHKTNLPGLAGFDYLGFWGAGYHDYCWEELNGMGVNMILPSGIRDRVHYDLYGTTTQMHVDYQSSPLYNNEREEDGSCCKPLNEWVFTPQDSEQYCQDVLDAADTEGGVVYNSSFYKFFYAGHEVGEIASYEERKEIKRVFNQYFPDVKVMWYYGGTNALLVPENRHSTHDRGFSWQDFKFGEDEADIAISCVSRGIEIRNGKRIFNPQIVLNSLIRHMDVLARDPKAIFISCTQMAGSNSSMWTPWEIITHARILFSMVDAPNGISSRGWGRLGTDLRMGSRCMCVTMKSEQCWGQNETGWIDERKAFGIVGSWRRNKVVDLDEIPEEFEIPYVRQEPGPPPEKSKAGAIVLGVLLSIFFTLLLLVALVVVFVLSFWAVKKYRDSMKVEDGKVRLEDQL